MSVNKIKNMDQKNNEIEINGVKYVQKDSVKSESLTNKFLVRCESAGVFFGEITAKDLTAGTARLSNARRIWYWSGASSLSQLSIDGTSKPGECKFPEAVQSIEVCKVIEVIPCTEKAAKSLSEVKIWKQ